ncbi:pyridoxamine 5'-phosphate oxidase family protein [Ancylobacter sp. A5.8]|uniref:pyridoxamine 5'-phosphate oxidase family protein n=1 Tax=Ancylobacter gelatini TaxID=2919920 RepID=UPI001F4E59C8|nr:pyridoxamine 5'-phosphate oxidase family protein [Ancylobacter gelatini]MCJ8143992.1 pyridoxamine 5'-phosphate oxidase family protein [Ancylobacter gelatini]
MNENERTTAEAIDRAWEMMEDIRICMLVTRAGETLRGRPMDAHASREEGCIWFLSDRRGHKDEELNHDPQAALTFAKPGDNTYLSVSGQAEVSNDRAKIDELWSDMNKAFWPKGKTDPNICVVRFLPERAEYWDGPSTSIGVLFKMMAARLSGSPTDLGENRQVPLD